MWNEDECSDDDCIDDDYDDDDIIKMSSLCFRVPGYCCMSGGYLSIYNLAWLFSWK